MKRRHQISKLGVTPLPYGKLSQTVAIKTQRQITRNSSLSRKGTTQQVKQSDENNHIVLSQRSLSSEKKVFSQSMESKKSLRPETDINESDSAMGYTLGNKEKIVEITCGSLHTLIRTNSRRVLSTGYGESYALGHKDTETSSNFRPINLFTEQNIAVIKIACGPNSSGCITQEGNVYIWGLINYSSEDKPIYYKVPTRFPFESNIEEKGSSHRNFKLKTQQSNNVYSSQNRATDIKMGDGFSVVLTEKGLLYSFGTNCYGQLGIGDYKSHEFAEKIKIPGNIIQISCGNDHCLAINNENMLYCWGSNSYGQLGNDLEDKNCTPNKISVFEGIDVFRIACGSNSSFSLSYGKPKMKLKKDIVKNTGLEAELKNLQNEVAKLRLELALKSKLEIPKLPKSKTNKENENFDNSHSCLEIDIKDLVYVEKITEGGYGIVYLGKWHETPVAIKEIKMEYVTEDKLDEFLTECNTMELVRHPNIVLFLGACTRPPKICIVLEYCEMGSLWTLLHFTKTELPWKLRKQIAIDIARSVNYLHCFPTPLLHRDLKSLNVLLDNNLTAKLADFGWARIKETVMTGRIGTYQWMAPEVISSSHYTEKADVYSFGVIMWEMASRKPPYYGIDVSEVAHRVVHKNYRPPIKDLNVPFSWTSLMKRCWQKESSKRPSFSQIIHELEAIKEY